MKDLLCFAAGLVLTEGAGGEGQPLPAPPRTEMRAPEAMF